MNGLIPHQLLQWYISAIPEHIRRRVEGLESRGRGGDEDGAYPLPEGQLDRFMLATSLGYPGFEDELQMLASHVARHSIDDLAPVFTPEAVVTLAREVRAVFVSEVVRRYALQIIARTRTAPAALSWCWRLAIS